MKHLLKYTLALSCAAVSAFGLSACGQTARADLLGAPKSVTALSYQERQSDKVKRVSAGAEKFAAQFAPIVYKGYEEADNFAVAPVSVYMALALAAQCAGGNTREEILSVLGVNYDNLAEGFSDYYRSLFADYKGGQVTLSNSIWIDNRARVNTDCIDTLADKFFCYSYKAGFYDDNAAANAAVSKFVKDKTKGLIDRNFQLGELTKFALINTLYLKDIWNNYGNDLPFTDKLFTFENADASTSDIKLLQGYYRSGRAAEGESYKTFFTSTNSGSKIKFILPKDGYTVDDVFTAKTVSEINALNDFNAVDEVNKIKYFTRCLFPEYSASYNDDVKDYLREMGVNDLFSIGDCDFSGITPDDVYCDRVVHSTKLKVDKTGVEGAAVTVMSTPDSAAPPEKIYEEVYLDFVIDRSFGFVLTDCYGNTLFSGVVKKV